MALMTGLGRHRQAGVPRLRLWEERKETHADEDHTHEREQVEGNVERVREPLLDELPGLGSLTEDQMILIARKPKTR